MSFELKPYQLSRLKKNLRKVPIRAVSWEPVQTASGSWRLNVPPTVSPTGKRQQLFFPTEEAARDEASRLRDTRRTFGSLLTQVDPHELSEAVKALELLRPHGIGLLTAVTEFLADHTRRQQSRTLAQAFDAYEATGAHWSRDYRKEVEHTRAAMADLIDRPLPDIEAGVLEAALSRYAPSTRDARIRRLRSVFNEAVRQGWCAANPADRLNFACRRRDEVRIYAVADVQNLLERALATDRVMLPFLAICAFCGLRPENEAANLIWSDVHLDDDKPQIVVRPETSKTRRRRFVDISDNCIAWLKASGASRSGRVMPYSPATLKRHRDKLLAADKEKQWGELEWINDGLRHTYCSAYLTKHESVDRLLMQTGHSDPKVLWRHYYRVMTKADAEKYWGIEPKG